MLFILLSMHIVASRLQKEGFLTRSGVDDPGVERPLFWPLSHPIALFSTTLTSARWVRTAVTEQVTSRAKGLISLWPGRNLYTETCRHTRSQANGNFSETPLMVTA